MILCYTYTITIPLKDDILLLHVGHYSTPEINTSQLGSKMFALEASF